MNRIKCVNCGFVSWATAETCKKCGVPLTECHEVGSPSHSNNQTPGRAKRIGIVLAVIALIAISAGVFAFTRFDRDGAQTFVLKDGSTRKSKAWFHTWSSSDPSVDEILAKYLKVSGWEANPSALTSFVAKGRFQIRNEPGEMTVDTRGPVHFQVRLQWESCDGEVEFEGQAPDKIVITQKYDGPKVLQRGTNGKSRRPATRRSRRSSSARPA
jgi:hypothetical protein